MFIVRDEVTKTLFIMTYSFKTKINFRNSISKQEQFAFWCNALKSVKKIALTGSLTFDENSEWCVDYSECSLNEAEVKMRFAAFLERQKNIIKDYSMYSLSAA